MIEVFCPFLSLRDQEELRVKFMCNDMSRDKGYKCKTDKEYLIFYKSFLNRCYLHWRPIFPNSQSTLHSYSSNIKTPKRYNTATKQKTTILDRSDLLPANAGQYDHLFFARGAPFNDVPQGSIIVSSAFSGSLVSHHTHTHTSHTYSSSSDTSSEEPPRPRFTSSV